MTALVFLVLIQSHMIIYIIIIIIADLISKKTPFFLLAILQFYTADEAMFIKMFCTADEAVVHKKCMKCVWKHHSIREAIIEEAAWWWESRWLSSAECGTPCHLVSSGEAGNSTKRVLGEMSEYISVCLCWQWNPPAVEAHISVRFTVYFPSQQRKRTNSKVLSCRANNELVWEGMWNVQPFIDLVVV